MANDKDFLLKNAVEVGGPTKVTLGTVTANNVDLSTGNYFADTPSGTSTYTFSNAGDVQSFQIEVTGGTAEVAQNFSTTLYTGNGTTQTITNGIDLAGDGGLVWVKTRAVSDNHSLVDTERGGNFELNSNTTSGQGGGMGFSFNSDGFTLGSSIKNANTAPYVSWTFKKEPSFFDVVTWTGDGTSARTISHNLGTTVGSIIVKAYSVYGENWTVYHRGLNVNGDNAPETDGIYLNLTNAAFDESGFWNDTAPTDTNFTVGANLNSSFGGGVQYVAYLFAHDDAADGLIKCGSYTGTGSEQVINLGWQAQWVLIKNASNSAGWYLVDLERGMTDTDQDGFLYANASTAEGNEANNLGVNAHSTDPNGFKVASNGTQINFDGGDTYIYIAIRAASDPDITWPASVQWTGGTAPSSPAVSETDVYTFVTDDGGTSYVGIQSADNLS